MDLNLIAELLKPFFSSAIHNTTNPSCSDRSQTTAPDHQEPAKLLNKQLANISTYIDLLIRWNSRMNLTAIRDPEQIVTRHFGESLFAARHLFPPANGATTRVAPGQACPEKAPGDSDHTQAASTHHLLDIGSGPGFPALPIKIWAPKIRLTLVESNQKKATFLREVARAITLMDVNVINSRAEDIPAAAADTVTLRAVERFNSVLATAIRLTRPGGRVALLIGESQLEFAQADTTIKWSQPLPIPQSASRLLLLGERASS